MGDDTEYDSEDEAFAQPIAANLEPVSGQIIAPGQPIKLDINSNKSQSSHLPLCMLLNARSLYNKEESLRNMLRNIGPDVALRSCHVIGTCQS